MKQEQLIALLACGAVTVSTADRGCLTAATHATTGYDFVSYIDALVRRWGPARVSQALVSCKPNPGLACAPAPFIGGSRPSQIASVPPDIAIAIGATVTGRPGIRPDVVLVYRLLCRCAKATINMGQAKYNLVDFVVYMLVERGELETRAALHLIETCGGTP